MNWWREVGREGERGREREEFRDFARSAVYVSSHLAQRIPHRLLPTRPGARVLQTGGAEVESVCVQIVQTQIGGEEVQPLHICRHTLQTISRHEFQAGGGRSIPYGVPPPLCSKASCSQA